jgi:EmrB/QacA subfamily drug resistance transporter
MINSYLLSFCIFVVIAGKFADIFGHRKIFSLGMLFFGVFSFFCGISNTSSELIIFRFFQGIGSAMMVPASTAILFEAFSERQRGRVMGISSSVTSIGVTLGPLVGGFFTQYLSWHYIFFINVPISLIGLIFTLKFIKKSPKIKEKIDFLGFISFAIGITSLTLILMQGKILGFKSVPMVLLYISTIMFFLLFYFSSKKIKNPFINFSIFKILPFSCILITIFTISLARMMSVYWVIFFQNILNLTPLYAGAITMISCFPMIFFSPYAGKLVDKNGPRISIIAGQILIILSFALLIFFMPMGNIIMISIALLSFGMGLILSMIASYSYGVGIVPENKRGAATGIITTFRNTASSLGVAILGSLFLHTQFNKFSHFLMKNKDTANLNPNIFEGLLSKTKASIQALKALPANIQLEIKEAMKASYNYGITFANLVAIFVVAFGLFVILYYFKPKQKKLEKEELTPGEL